MILNRHKNLYWKLVLDELFGEPSGYWLCVDYSSGGGFAGAPEVLVLAPASGIAPGEPSPQLAEFPSPCSLVEYRVGGRSHGMYHYFKG
jgi:hypothetical protein